MIEWPCSPALEPREISPRAGLRAAGALGLALWAGVTLATAGWAEVLFYVDSTLDQVDDDTADGVCHTAAGTCTLRAAVMQANRTSGAGAIIVLAAGTYDLTRPAAPWHEPVTLEADGIRLRAWRPDDVEAIELDDTPEHFEPPGARQTPENYAEWLLRRQERMSQGTSTWWCITDAATDRALGLVTLIEGGQEPGTAELGYALFPSARGRGATTIASRLVVDYAFAETGGRGLRKLSALTVGDNDKSAAVLTRLGFTEWGREPAFCEREDGTLDDARHWVLLRP